MLNEEISEALISFTKHVFQRMVSLDVEGEAHTGEIHIPGTHLTAMVGFAGSYVGMTAVHSSDAFGRRIAESMVRSTGRTFSEVDVRDALGEVANVIAGQMKAHLSQTLADGAPVFEQSVPSVICGEHYDMYTVTKVPRICIRFNAENDSFFVELALKKAV